MKDITFVKCSFCAKYFHKNCLNRSEMLEQAK